ncbi:hypothetical protein BB561_000145 [Smittium simulii]|uniref:Cytochrome P450 n=1 Tax=Smittium simulii TaxID=133385 RepID=A0A2T9Z0I1_9FUNG|nr:hypothetical protein BB561_000145 [Smittium simulii]
MYQSFVKLIFQHLIDPATHSKFWIKLLCSYAFYKTAYLCLFDPLRHVPGPWWSRFTSIPYQLERGLGTIDRYSHSIHLKYGKTVRVGPTEVSVSKNKDVKQILSSYRYRKSDLYKLSMAVKENMITTLDETFNRTRRRQVAPAFSHSGLDTVEDLILQVGIIALKKKLDEELVKGKGEYKINYYSVFQCVTADIIGELSFGKSFDAIKNEGHDILKWVQSFMKISVLCVIFPLTMKIPFFFPGLKYDREMLINYTAKSIKNRCDEIESNVYKPNRIDILQMYITSNNPDGTKLSEDDLVSESLLMLLAGTDTSSVTMSWLLHFYTLYPSIYKKVVREIDEFFPDRSKIIRYKDAQKKLVYFIATVYECMRLKPALSGVLPRTSSNEGIQLSDYYIPPNIELFLVVEVANCDETVWDSPNKYMPERFLNEKGKSLTKELVTFSSGVRICPGRNLAWVEILTVMPNFIRDYEIRLMPDSFYRPDNIDANRDNEPLLFEDYVLGTRGISNYKNVCNVIISKRLT